MVLQVGRSTSTGKSSEARSANGLKWSRVSSQARIKIPCPAQPDALATIHPLAAPGGPAPGAASRSTSALVEPVRKWGYFPAARPFFRSLLEGLDVFPEGVSVGYAKAHGG